MNSRMILQHIEEWAKTRDFSAPYGILTGEHTNKKGHRYLSVTFGRSRTLDASVEIYNRNFLVLRTNRTGTKAYKSLDELMTVLETL